MPEKERKTTAGRGTAGARAKASTAANTKTKGAYKGGHAGQYIFNLYDLQRVPAGGTDGELGSYADTRAVVVEGQNVQVGLAFEKRGCGSEPHTHPNEQFNFVVKSNSVAVNLWRSVGFEIIGEIPDAFRHSTNGLTNAYIMYRKL